MNPEEREQRAERLLEAALRQYSQAVPHAGLESRVLANLVNAHERKLQLPGSSRLAWLAVAALLLIAIAGGVRWSHREPKVARNVAPRIAPSMLREIDSLPKPAPPAFARPPAPHRHTAAATRHSTPHLDRFPRSTALTEQDRLMLLYVENTPRAELLETNARLAAQREAELKRFLSGAVPSDEAGTAQ
jgi:hypothetical protein